jgi:signal peptidase
MSSGKSRKRELTETVVLFVIGIVIVWGCSIGLQLYLGTTTPLLAVESESMEPTLYRGDLVVVRSVEPESLQVGDIIIFQSSMSDVPVVHRIVAIGFSGGELQFTTKGDNNPSVDPNPVPGSAVLAKVVGSIRYLGFITLVLILPGGVFFIVFLIAIFLLTSILCEGFTERKEE